MLVCFRGVCLEFVCGVVGLLIALWFALLGFDDGCVLIEC